jgi:hypothetical protein
MSYLDNNRVASGSQTDHDNYFPPEITVFEINLEKGFATSSSADDWESTTW